MPALVKLSVMDCYHFCSEKFSISRKEILKNSLIHFKKEEDEKNTFCLLYSLIITFDGAKTITQTILVVGVV